MPSSLSEVAQMARVSLGTASSVLTGRKGFRVAPETAERVKLAANQLGYKPNRLARALATGKTRLIALIDYDFGANYSARLARQFHVALSADRYDLVIFGEAAEPAAIATLVDGAICCSRYMPKDLDAVMPVVQISSEPDTLQDALRLDFQGVSTEAMEVFGKAGCETVAYVGQASGTNSTDERLAAYREFVCSTGRHEIVIDTPLDRQPDGYETLVAYTSKNDWPQGLFCRNDEVALGAYRAIREAGLRVGQDVAVIGCDDIEADFFDPPLTSLSVPFTEISTIAWTLLRERIQTKDLPQRVLGVAPKLVVRASSNFAKPAKRNR